MKKIFISVVLIGLTFITNAQQIERKEYKITSHEGTTPQSDLLLQAYSTAFNKDSLAIYYMNFKEMKQLWFIIKNTPLLIDSAKISKGLFYYKDLQIKYMPIDSKKGKFVINKSGQYFVTYFTTTKI